MQEHERQPTRDSEQVRITTREQMRREGYTPGEQPPEGYVPGERSREGYREGYLPEERAREGAARLEMPEEYNVSRDRVRWGAIWAGVITAFTVLMLMGLLGLVIGLTAIDPATAGGAAPAIWGGLSAIVAFLAGGFVAGRMGAIFDRSWGAWNGALVFMLALPLTLLLIASGFGTLLGVASNLAGVLPEMQGAAGGAGVTPPTVTQQDIAQATATARDAALGSLIGIVLGIASGAIGGALGTRRRLDIERTQARVTTANA